MEMIIVNNAVTLEREMDFCGLFILPFAFFAKTYVVMGFQKFFVGNEKLVGSCYNLLPQLPTLK
jgi:hypothetical protein